jgi:hypothetical protein
MVVAAGQKISIAAADWNDLQSMLSQWRANGRRLAPDGASISGGSRGHEILIKNTTSSDIAAFGVLALDQPVIDFTTTANASERFNGIRFKGIAPSTSTPHYGKFCVLQEPALKTSGFARAVVAGMTLVKLNIVDAEDTACDITNNQTGYLTTSGHGSARLLWKQNATGTDKWGLAVLGGWDSAMLGKTDASHAKGASGTVSIWDGAEGSEVDTGVNVTAYNRFAAVASGKWVWVHSKRGRIYLTAAEC